MLQARGARLTLHASVRRASNIEFISCMQSIMVREPRNGITGARLEQQLYPKRCLASALNLPSASQRGQQLTYP